MDISCRKRIIHRKEKERRKKFSICQVGEDLETWRPGDPYYPGTMMSSCALIADGLRACPFGFRPDLEVPRSRSSLAQCSFLPSPFISPVHLHPSPPFSFIHPSIHHSQPLPLALSGPPTSLHPSDLCSTSHLTSHLASFSFYSPSSPNSRSACCQPSPQAFPSLPICGTFCCTHSLLPIEELGRKRAVS